MSMDNKKRLGRGIGSLLEGFEYDLKADKFISKEDENKDQRSLLKIKIDRIKINPTQPRKTFNEEKLSELATSIKEKGVLEPILVEEYLDSYYSIVAGERRYRAAKIAGLLEIPAIVVSLSEAEKLEVALIENIQREDLNAIEEATAYLNLMKKLNLSQEEVAERVGKSRSAVANSLRLLYLPDKIKDDVITGAISAGHARALLSLKNPLDREILRERIINEGLSVRKAEEIAEVLNKGQKIKQKKKLEDIKLEIVETERKFNSFLGLDVEIKGKLEKGKLIIKYKNIKALENIYYILSNGEQLFED